MRPFHIFCIFLVVAAVRLMVIIPIFYETIFPIQIYDSYIYILKALEITKGNWLPIHTHAIGLPIFLAPFLYVWGAHSIFENILVGIIITAVTGAAIVFPLAGLTYRLTGSKKGVLIALIAFSLSFSLMISGELLVLTEPLFTLLLLVAIYCMYKAHAQPFFAYLASAVAGIGYWVRPNGIIVLLIVLVSYCIMRRKTDIFYTLRTTALMAGIFFVVSGPMLYSRHSQFGSAFDYGENNKYFMERYVDVWGAVSSVSFRQYLTTHSAKEIFKRFFVTGAGLAFLYFAYMILPVIFFFLYGITVTWRNPVWIPIWTAIGIWIMGLIPIFHLYYIPRHLFPIAPLGIAVAAAGVIAIVAIHPESEKTVLAAFVATQVAVLCISISIFFFGLRRFTMDISRITADSMVWARWAAIHVKGVLAIGNGINIMMLLPDTQIAGRGLQDLIAPKSGLRIMYPGQFASLSEAMPVLKARGATHVLLENKIYNPLPLVSDKYLSIYNGEKIPFYFKEIYSNYGTNSQSKVRIFEINWDQYGIITAS